MRHRSPSRGRRRYCSRSSRRAHSRVPDSVSTELRFAQAGVLRRFGAMLYDGLVVIALLMTTTALLLLLTGGEAITSAKFGALELAYQALLLALIVAFFGWCWTRRGQ